MKVSAYRAFDLLRALAYERVSCSEAEKTAAERLLVEAQSAGAEAHLESFPVKCGRVQHAKLVVTAPYEKEYECTGYERSLSTPENGVDLPFFYAENVLPAHLPHVRGKAVMVNGRLGRKVYEKLQKAGAAAILTFDGTTLDRRADTDCDIRKLRETLTDDLGQTVALHLRTMDAVEIVRRGATQMHIELAAEDYEGTSQNVCAVIPGTDHPNEIVSLGAHYDSVYFSTGVYDNLSGSVILMELLRYFAMNPPARTLKFNWYGSEEQGLLGSKAWVKAHEDELDKHVLMINIDVAAPILGQNAAPVLATEKAVGYVDAMMREAGIPCDVKLDIYSSDCIPFADRGVPAVNLCRFGVPGAGYIHDRRDNLRSGYISTKALEVTLNQALLLTERVANAAICPIEKVVSDDIRKKVDEYLFKKPEKK